MPLAVALTFGILERLENVTYPRQRRVDNLACWDHRGKVQLWD
jgi:hypothetical protein